MEMRLIIQIPCFNEEKTLPVTFADLPKKIEGIDIIETQIINDGSTDGTEEIARKLGVNHIISFKKNKGLAAAFKAGVDHALAMNADILVNTDGDNQYCGKDVVKLVNPILNGAADMVVGCRPIDNYPGFSFVKKKFQKLGSWVLRRLSDVDVKDAASGFRAYNKNALLSINIFSRFSYCMETLIQAGYSNLKITSVDINVNPKTRESRLFKSIAHYIWRSGVTIINIFLLYKSVQLFTVLSLVLLLASISLMARYLVLITFKGAPVGVFWPSIILAGILLTLSFFVYLTGILALLISANRKLSEEVLFKLRKLESNAEVLKKRKERVRSHNRKSINVKL